MSDPTTSNDPSFTTPVEIASLPWDVNLRHAFRPGCITQPYSPVLLREFVQELIHDYCDIKTETEFQDHYYDHLVNAHFVDFVQEKRDRRLYQYDSAYGTVLFDRQFSLRDLFGRDKWDRMAFVKSLRSRREEHLELRRQGEADRESSLPSAATGHESESSTEQAAYLPLHESKIESVSHTEIWRSLDVTSFSICHLRPPKERRV